MKTKREELICQLKEICEDILQIKNEEVAFYNENAELLSTIKDTIATLEMVLLDGMQNDTYIVVEDMEKHIHKIECRNIMYIYSNDHKVWIYTRDGEIECRQTLHKMEMMLSDKGFYRCHKSYLINLSEVKEYGKDVIIMSDKKTVFLARRRRKELISKFNDYNHLRQKSDHLRRRY